jgi:hypothetical protein
MVGHRRGRGVHVFEALRVAHRPPEDASQTSVERRPFRLLDDGLREQRRIEAPGRLDAELGAAVATVFEAEQAGLEPMDALDADRALEPGHVQHRRSDIDAKSALAGRCGPAQDRLHVLPGIIALPGEPVDLVPLLRRHAGMARDPVVEVVFVDVRIHRNSGPVQALVILGSRKRRQVKKLQQLDRELALDHLDVVQDRFGGVVREAQDVAHKGQDAHVLEREQEPAVLGDLVLALLGAEEVLRVDVLEAEERGLDPGERAFLDEARDAVAQGIDLNREAEREAFDPAQIDQPIEDRLPILVAGEIVVGDEEFAKSLGVVRSNDFFDIVGRAAPGFPALHVDDGAERALVGAAPAGVEACGVPKRAADHVRGQYRTRDALYPRQVVHMVVEGPERADIGVLQHPFEPSFRLPAKSETPISLARRKSGSSPSSIEITPET